MEISAVIAVVLTFVLVALISINKKLSILVEINKSKVPSEELSTDIKDNLSEIKSILEDIRYTTDIIENYRLPTAEDRKSIDLMRIDQEIDEMLSKEK